MPDGFPEAVWIGGKRVVSQERFEGWLADKIGKSCEPAARTPRRLFLHSTTQKRGDFDA
jgi:hypothetical protein